MRAAVLREGRMVERDDASEPIPEPGQVLVQVKACGICGSDLHFAKHGARMMALGSAMKGMPTMGDGGPMVDLGRDVYMGHEFAAEGRQGGKDTESVAPGTVVASLPV